MQDRESFPVRVAKLSLPLLLLCVTVAAGPVSAGCSRYDGYWRIVAQLDGSGGATAVSGNHAFTAGGRSFSAIDVSTPENPILVAQIPLRNAAMALAASGPVACVTERDDEPPDGCMQVIDIHDPVHPVIAATMPELEGASGVAVWGSHAFVLRSATLVVVDLSSIDAPAIVGSVQLPGTPLAVAASGSYAYVTVGNRQDPATQGLYVINVTDPAAPFVAAFVRTTDQPEDLGFVAQSAYVAAHSALDVIDLSDPLHPVLVTSVPLDPLSDARAITVSDKIVYVQLSGLHAGLQAIDIGYPGYPYLLDVLAGEFGRGVAYGSYLVAGPHPGFCVLNTGNPTNPSPVGSLDIPGFNVVASGTHAYSSDGYRLSVLDVSDPADPRIVDGQDLLGVGPMVTTQRFLYALQDDYSEPPALLRFDLSDPGHPTLAGSIHLPDPSVDVSVASDDSFAYVATGAAGLTIVDCRGPSWSIAAVLDTPGWAQGVAASGSYVYVADDSSGVQVVDVSDPSQPQIVANVPGDRAWNLAVSGDFLYVAESRFMVVDISRPEAPRVVSRSAADVCRHVEIQGSMAYLTFDCGVDVRDVSDPTSPRRTGYLSLPLGCRRPYAAAQGSLVLAAASTGLQIYWPQCAPADVAGGVSHPWGLDLRVAPNPTTRGVELHLVVPRPGPLEVSIYDPAGRRVRRLVEGVARTGAVHLAWDGLDERGREVAAGTYFVRAATAGGTRSVRIVRMR